MKIHVTQDDINTGEPRNIQNCAITRALRRQLGDRFPDICMVAGYIRLTRTGGFLTGTIRTDKAVDKWREDFDARRPVSPMSFDLEMPQ